MRIVIDTNIFISSFFGGNPRKIINLWKDGKIILCVSKTILDEYFEVLVRIGLDKEELEEILSLIKKGLNMLYTNKTPKICVVEKDPDDDKFLECAVALKAKIIVTGDKALRDVSKYMDIKILTPKQFLDETKF